MAINMLGILNKIKGTDRGRSLGQTAINMTRMVANKKHGQGTYSFANGNEYVGEWNVDERMDRGRSLGRTETNPVNS